MLPFEPGVYATLPSPSRSLSNRSTSLRSAGESNTFKVSALFPLSQLFPSPSCTAVCKTLKSVRNRDSSSAGDSRVSNRLSRLEVFAFNLRRDGSSELISQNYWVSVGEMFCWSDVKVMATPRMSQVFLRFGSDRTSSKSVGFDCRGYRRIGESICDR